MPARVLVVSAQAPIQLQLANTLRADGHDIAVGSDGQAALRIWANDHPDLVVIDSELPDLRGIEVVTRIRQSEQPPAHTPMVLVGTGGSSIVLPPRNLPNLYWAVPPKTTFSSKTFCSSFGV